MPAEARLACDCRGQRCVSQLARDRRGRTDARAAAERSADCSSAFIKITSRLSSLLVIGLVVRLTGCYDMLICDGQSWASVQFS